MDRSSMSSGSSTRHSPQTSRQHRRLEFRRNEVENLRTQALYYEQQLARFQEERKRWVDKQEEILETEQLAVQYVFLENIETVKLFGDGASKIRVITKDGGEITLHDINVTNATELEKSVDDNLRAIALDIEAEVKTKATSDGCSDSNYRLNSLSRNHLSVDRYQTGSSLQLRVLDESGDVLDFYQGAKHQTLIELQGRINDLIALNNIYFPGPLPEMHGHHHSSSAAKEEGVSRVIRDIELRHEQIRGRLSMFPAVEDAEDGVDQIDEMLRENNEQWQYLVYQIGKDMEENNATALQMEIESRTNQLEAQMSIVNGHDVNSHPKNSIDSIYGHQKSNSSFHQAEHQNPLHWLSIIDDLGSGNESIESRGAPLVLCPSAQLHAMVIEELLREMNQRRHDLDVLSGLHKSDQSIDAVNEARKLQNEALKRQQARRQRFSERAHVAAAKNGQSDGNENIDNACLVIEEVHKKWQEQLSKLIADTEHIDAMKQLNLAAMEELEGRTADLLTMRDIHDETLRRGTGDDDGDDDDEDLDRNDQAADAMDMRFISLQLTICDRHQGIEHNIHDAVGLCDEIDRRLLDAVKQSDSQWREAVFNPADKDASSARRMTTVLLHDIDAVSGLDAKPRWLDEDEQRNSDIDAILVDDTQRELLQYVTSYCHFILCAPHSDGNTVGAANNRNVVGLYFPIPDDNTHPPTHHIISALHDAVMLCEMISRIAPDAISQSAVNHPEPADPHPLTNQSILLNVSLLFSAAKSMGIDIGKHEIADWLDPSIHTAMLCQIVNGIAEYALYRQLPMEQRSAFGELTKPIGVLKLFYNIHPPKVSNDEGNEEERKTESDDL